MGMPAHRLGPENARRWQISSNEDCVMAKRNPPGAKKRDGSEPWKQSGTGLLSIGGGVGLPPHLVAGSVFHRLLSCFPTDGPAETGAASADSAQHNRSAQGGDWPLQLMFPRLFWG